MMERFTPRAREMVERAVEIATESRASEVRPEHLFAALLWANSPWADSYFGLWRTPLGVSTYRYRDLCWLRLKFCALTQPLSSSAFKR